MSLSNLDKNSLSFSVLIPCLNEEKYIQAALSSIIQSANLTHESYEIIIIDGESTDKTISRIRPLLDDGDILISEPDQGLYHALNKGFCVLVNRAASK